MKVGSIYTHIKTTEIIEITKVTSWDICGVDIPMVYFNNWQSRIKLGKEYFYLAETRGKLGFMHRSMVRDKYRKIGKL